MKIIKSGSLKFYPPKEKTIDSIMDEIINVHHRTSLFSLISGGKDSMSTTDILANKFPEQFKGVAHIKTHIGLKMTTDFVEEICEEMGWKLYILEPQPKNIFASWVLQYGFPSAGAHRMIMGVLKYKPMRDFALTIDRKKHCLISGIRKFESKRRMGNYPLPIQSDGALWFGCPMFYKSSEETYRYVHENGLKISPAYKLGLGTSGECECGSFAMPHEKNLIRRLDSDLADYIDWLEVGIEKFGTAQAKKFGKWGMQPKISELEEQQMITRFLTDNPDLNDFQKWESMVCGQECGPGSMKGMLDY